MIGPGTGVRVYLACGATDMRNYVATMIMRSRERISTLFRAVMPSSTPHNFAIVRQALRAACPGAGICPV